MRSKKEVNTIWDEICNNCNDRDEVFAGVTSNVWEGTISYIKKLDNPIDMFSLATLSKDKEAIDELYNSITLNERQKELLEDLKNKNREVLLTVNPFILEEKYSFLTPVLEELSLDTIIQDKLLSLDDFELDLLEKITNYSLDYGVKPNRLLARIISNIGYSSITLRNNEASLEKIRDFLNIVKEYANTHELDDKEIKSIAFILATNLIPSNMEEVTNYDNEIKKAIEINMETAESSEDAKKILINFIYGLNSFDAEDLVKAYNMKEIPDEMLSEPGVIEWLSLKMIVEEENLEKLKEVANLITKDPNYEIGLFNNLLMEENILKLYAREFNNCKPKFEEENYLFTKDGIKFYDSGLDFYAIVKTLGAFSDDGKGEHNYYDEWNDNRYRSHVNAVSLIRNDNLAFAEVDGKVHIKLGFLNFEENMLLGGGTSDMNSTPDSRELWTQMYSKLYFPNQFINHTRKWHNELDYERKNGKPSSQFKKNPDFIIIDQERENLDELSETERKEFDELVENSIRAAKEFGNLPILVINREKIAKNELQQLKNMLDEYKNNQDIELLKNVVIKFNNNRNGCRGPQHEYIREQYFSNDCYRSILETIDDVVLDEHRESITALVAEENTKMANCLYDKTAKDLPDLSMVTCLNSKAKDIQSVQDTKRGGLNV